MPIDTRAIQTELQRLLQRLARLIQEMGDCNRKPATTGCCTGPVPTTYLRPTYLHLLGQATHLVRLLGFAECEAPDYITTQLVSLLRASNHVERRQGMSLRAALGR